MSARLKTWITAALALAGVWIGVALLWTWARHQEPSAARTVELLERQPLIESMPANDRQQTIVAVAEQMNQLSFTERQRLRQNPALQRFYDQMTEPEKSRFLDLVLRRGAQQFMEAFNQMPPARRQELVEKALTELERTSAGGRQQVRQLFTEQTTQRIIQEGLTAYFRDANAETKLQLQPVLEQLQHLAQSVRQ